LMGLILQQNHELGCELVTYRVVPTGTIDGFIEYVVGAITICEANQGESQEKEQITLQNYLIDQNQNANYTEVRNMYIRSMAFWSVATLLLGVGDRHSCNIMIKPNGALFHIDYGFILGEDPKPLVPYMRITRDMVDVMGGKDSKSYGQFLRECVRVYLRLREYSQLFFDMIGVLFFWDPPICGEKPSIEYANEIMKQLHNRFKTRQQSLIAESALRQWIEESYANPMLEIVDLIRRHNLNKISSPLPFSLSRTNSESSTSSPQTQNTWFRWFTQSSPAEPS